MDIYLSTDKSNLISTIDSITVIEKELNVFEQKTGITIDEYGKTNLYVDHIKLLNSLIKESNEWTMIFQKAIDLNSGLIIEGD